MSETGDPALIGRRVANKFLVERFLGGGAMGAVYRAKDTTLDRSVALKVMHPAVAVDPSFVKRFHREARAASRIDHPYAMRVIEFGEEPDGLLYIAMEYLEGRDLYKVIHEDWPLPEPRIADIMNKALSAMQLAHDMGVIHRDLKPENIMVLNRKDDEDKDIVKVCDFGIAKITESDEESASRKATGAKLTTSGLVVGTPEYMSPEQARGEKLDARSDLYSMGVILYQLLTGRTPFLADTALAVVLKHITENPESPAKHYPGVHKGLEEVCMKSLRKEKTDRFQSAREMRLAIRAVMDGKPIPVEANAATLADMNPVTGPNPLAESTGAPNAFAQSGHLVVSPVSSTLGNVPPPPAPAPAIISSKTTPLGTSVVSESTRPAKTPSKTPIFAALGLGAVAVGVVGVMLIKPRLMGSSTPTAPVTATVSVSCAEEPKVPTSSSAPINAPEPPLSASPVESTTTPKHAPPSAPVIKAVPKPGVNATPPPAPEPAPAPAPAPEPAPAPAPAPVAPPPAPAPAPAPAAFNPNTCRAQIGTKRGVNGSHPQELTLSGTEVAWNNCAHTSIKEKPAAPIAATVRLKFSDNRAFRGATCTGCTPALQACIAASTGKTVSVNFKSGDVTGEPDFDVPVTFTCD